MDGARMFNAAVYLKVPASRIVRDFASASFCISKGLGAPVGAILVGDKEFIRKQVSLCLIGMLNLLALKLLCDVVTQSGWYSHVTSNVKIMSWSGLKTSLVVLHYKQF